MSELKSTCTCCGEKTEITNLRCVPETDTYYRKMASNLLNKLPHEHTDVDTGTLLCPTCFDSLFGSKN